MDRLFGGGEGYFLTGQPPSYQPATVFEWVQGNWQPVFLGVGGQCLSLSQLEDSQGAYLFLSGYESGSRWARVFRLGTWSLPPAGMYSSSGYPSTTPIFSLNDGTNASTYGLSFPAANSGAPARWNGASWDLLGPPDAGAMFVYVFGAVGDGTSTHLVVAGDFHTIGGISAPRIAQWTGTTWQAFPPPPDFGIIRCLCNYDDGTGDALFIGGDTNGGIGQPVLKWNGQAWQPIAFHTWSSSLGNAQVNAMHVHDDGSGPALYVAGYFANAGFVPANNIAKWNGQRWSAVLPGIGFQVYDFASFNDRRGPSLFAAGTFTTAGGGYAPSVVQLVGCPNCYANCDASSAPPLLNINDFLCFLNAFARRDPYANCDLSSASPALNVNDFQCVLNAYASGCT
jgi:hypothetical protein